MTEIFGKLSELQRLDDDVHWFCDRKDATKTSRSKRCVSGSEEDSQQSDMRLKTDSETRCLLVFDCLQLFAYENSELDPQKGFLAASIDRQLSKCEECVMIYYKRKRSNMEKLRHEYDDSEVEVYSSIFDTRDVDRIRRGLHNANKTLTAIPPEKRAKEALEPSALMSIFEALSCEAFLTKYDMICNDFEEPFEMVQTRTRLRLTHFIPGATTFLFDPDPYRCQWALQTWTRYRSNLTKEDFDFAVREPLLRNLVLASGPMTDSDFLQRLWCGIRLIVDRLDGDLITHSFRAMSIDPCRLALEHLQYDSPGLRFLLQTIQRLLVKSPKDFWDALGAVSPTTLIEQIFNSPQYDQFILASKKEEEYDVSALKDMLQWVQPLMESLQVSHQPAASRSLTFQLLERLQADRFPLHARIECYHTGLAVLTWTLSRCNEQLGYSKNREISAVRRIVTAETLEVTGIHVNSVLHISTLLAEDERYTSLIDPAMRVIRTALTLECHSLKVDQETLQAGHDLPHSGSIYTQQIWRAVVQHLKRGNVPVARNALAGIQDLTGLEKFTSKNDDPFANAKSEFNCTFIALTHMVCQIFERIIDFTPDDLDKLYKSPDTANALVSTLFSADASTYEAGLNLIKSISGESAREEAIAHLLNPFFETTLNSFSWCIRRIAQKETYAACPRMLRTCTDVINILCDSQDGLLRSRCLAGTGEINALESFWQQQWEALKVIYLKTESWSRLHSDLKDFCRDTMQFSELFFDQYGIVTKSLESIVKAEQEKGSAESAQDLVSEKILKHPAQTVEAMSKFLRLRDEYLARTSVKLITKILHRLTEVGTALSDRPCAYLEDVVNSRVRTNLTLQEKAELARALEKNLDSSLDPVENEVERSDSSRLEMIARLSDRSKQDGFWKKSKTGDMNNDNRGSEVKQPKHVIDVPSDDEFGGTDIPDEDILSISRSVELLGEQKKQKAASTSALTTARITAIRKPRGKQLKSESEKIAEHVSFREKREREMAAKKKRDAEALLRVKKNLSSRIEEGSASLSTLGVKGKDYAPKGTGMMLSSGSDTGSDTEDELDRELFGKTTKVPEVSQAVKEYRESRTGPVNAGPVKKTRQVRSARDMRARLAPDLSNLHKTILSWDFFQQSDFPPNSDRDDYTLVTSTFRNPTIYQKTFEPLLVLEAWQGLLKSREEGNLKSFEINIANRLSVDMFVEISTTMTKAEFKDLLPTEADVILMSKGQHPLSSPEQPHCLARVSKIMHKKSVVEIAYRVNSGNPLLPAVVPKAVIFGAKIASITPLEREYGALLGLQYYDLCEEIIKAKASPLLSYADRQIAPIINNYRLNKAQAIAVRSAIDNDAFTLILGPPGSGKTKTIVAIVGALLGNEPPEKGFAISRPHASGPKNQIPLVPVPRKLLVCAPSNAAVDELVMRLKHGVKRINGDFCKISVVRLGRSDAINSNVVDVTLDELVSARLNTATGTRASGDELQKVMVEHKATCEKYNDLKGSRDVGLSKGHASSAEQEHEMEVLKRRKQELGNQIDMIRDNNKTAVRDTDITRRRIQQDILNEAHVICATLSGSGHEMFQNLSIEFETVIIDEAAQSIELSAIIPLKYGCAKCIMVGDPKQLPPTVLSREAARFQYEQSLFVRMQSNAPKDVHLLDTQYRMHPDISSFPSQAFYDGKLLDGQGMLQFRTRPWHQSSILGPYRFFDVEGSHQSEQRGHSLLNVAEVDVALLLYNRLVTDCPEYEFKGKVGIITTYKAQLRELRKRFAQKYGNEIHKSIEFNTTDAFQGRESEVIIFSCVRASASRSVGFLADIRRMNVGITRAQSSLWILGNSQALQQGEYWAKLIQNAKGRNKYSDKSVIDLLRKPSGTFHGKCALEKDPVRDRTEDTVMTDITSLAPISAPGLRDLHSGPLVNKTSINTKEDIHRPVESLPSNGVPAAASYYHPSGGSNGLDSNKLCVYCGSFAHFPAQCDHVKAKAKNVGGCHRCGDISHITRHCAAERCLECGTWGHVAQMCKSSHKLSDQEKAQLSNEKERNNTRPFLQRGDNKRKRDTHDPAVPIVKSTRRTPPLPVSVHDARMGLKSQQIKGSGDDPIGAPALPSGHSSGPGDPLQAKRQNPMPIHGQPSPSVAARGPSNKGPSASNAPETNGSARPLGAGSVEFARETQQSGLMNASRPAPRPMMPRPKKAANPFIMPKYKKPR